MRFKTEMGVNIENLPAVLSTTNGTVSISKQNAYFLLGNWNLPQVEIKDGMVVNQKLVILNTSYNYREDYYDGNKIVDASIIPSPREQNKDSFLIKEKIKNEHGFAMGWSITPTVEQFVRLLVKQQFHSVMNMLDINWYGRISFDANKIVVAWMDFYCTQKTDPLYPFRIQQFEDFFSDAENCGGFDTIIVEKWK